MTRQGSRLSAGELKFSFDGQVFAARSGDTAASALLAAGVRLLGRSVKYRRPRGLLTAGVEEPNALLTVGTMPAVVPNVAASQVLVREGLQLRSQNRWPTLKWDANSLLQLGSSFFGAGFYYKTFMWPSWRWYEGMIRRLAGLGSAPLASNLPPITVEHVTTDVLVAGGGPAGLCAALAAARAGARVVVCEREPVFGGELEFETAQFAGGSATQWLAETLQELQSRGVRLLSHTAVVGGSDGLLVAHRQLDGMPGRDAVLRIRPTALVLAVGAVERPIAFANNDLPGVMLLGAGERYQAGYGVAVGKRVVIFGNHDRIYAAARRLHSADMRVCAIVDTRSAPGSMQAQALRDQLRELGVLCYSHSVVVATSGKLAVQAALVASLDTPNKTQEIAADAILVSGGWSPAISPHASELGAFSACGACNGTLVLHDIVAESFNIGARAARRCGFSSTTEVLVPFVTGDAAPHLKPYWRVPASQYQEKRQFVDLQNDVTVADLRQALAEGFTHIEHVKRYTTLGIGTEQGRTSAVLGAAIVAELSGASLATVGTSRTRPPYQPVSLMALAGLKSGLALRPQRHTALHQQHIKDDAVLEPAGLWLRPRYYPANGFDALTAGRVEAARVRSEGGIFDASTLGKIEVAGPDAAAFLNSVYLNPASTLKTARAKYMVNLREDGMVLDDGIVLRLAEDRFIATVSSGHADAMLSHFEFWCSTQPRRYQVALTDVTECWAVIVVAGPQSRAKLQQVLGSHWHEPVASLTHMSFVSGQWRDRDLRVLRASFSGELAFELHCRPAIAAELWLGLKQVGLVPYGLEALDILRIEKGYLTNMEINGQTTPADLNMDGLLKLNNSCVGRELLARPAFQDPQRSRLVGLQAESTAERFLAGAQLTVGGADTVSVGHITSSAYSPVLGRWVGMALLSRLQAREGQRLIARDPLRGLTTAVTVVSPVHFDPASERMKA